MNLTERIIACVEDHPGATPERRLWAVCLLDGIREALTLRYKLPRKAAAKRMLETLHGMGITHTPDGARYSAVSIYSAMEGM